ncbi:MAG: type IV pilus secretin PilQ, partial [Bdellovibrionales bacterium]|nr:type IV pilus secretin PilQ [Bdellovibrionales bacterium]
TGKLTVTFIDAPAVLAAKGDAGALGAGAPAVVAELPEAVAPIEVAASEADVADLEVIEPAAEPAIATEEDIAAVAMADEATTEAASGVPSLDALSFEKTHNDAGEVLIRLSDAAAFELRRTAPSEYTLSLPGVEAASRTTIPQIAPKSFPGIRSARAIQTGENTEVRMFVDESVDLQAFPRGSEIVVQATPSLLAQNPQARAQLEAAEAPAEEGGVDDTARRNPTGIRSADGSKIYTGRIISLDLQDTDIDNALRIIAEVSNLNIIASDDVSGKVTLRLIDVPWDQALDVILKTNGLDQVTEGNVIRIAPVDKLRQEREALREAKRAAEQLEDLTVQYVRVSYARVGELVEQVATVLSERGSVIEDERTNQLIIKDIAKGHEEAVELIKRLDLRTPQVLLETQIVEGQRNILRDLGFQWNFTYVESPQTGNATGNNFPNSVTVGGTAADAGGGLQTVNFPAVLTDAAGSAIAAVLDSADGSRSLAARLSALETEGKVKVISRPQVATVNNKQAEIKSVETVRVRLPDSGTSIATGSGASASGGGRTAFEEIEVGIELTVTPQASPDYYVLMDVIARSSTFGSTVVDNIPSTLEREATSTILVKSGQTFALGGIYRIEDTDQIQGVPFLKDIPFLGVLFRRSFVDKSDEELIFFITPHIVEGSFDPSLM